MYQKALLTLLPVLALLSAFTSAAPLTAEPLHKLQVRKIPFVRDGEVGPVPPSLSSPSLLSCPLVHICSAPTHGFHQTPKRRCQESSPPRSVFIPHPRGSSFDKESQREAPLQTTQSSGKEPSAA
jgi:hypothetical protein